MAALNRARIKHLKNNTTAPLELKELEIALTSLNRAQGLGLVLAGRVIDLRTLKQSGQCYRERRNHDQRAAFGTQRGPTNLCHRRGVCGERCAAVCNSSSDAGERQHVQLLQRDVGRSSGGGAGAVKMSHQSA